MQNAILVFCSIKTIMFNANYANKVLSEIVPTYLA